MRGRPFEPGNKMGRGRPPGSRNKRTLFSEEFQKNGVDAIRLSKSRALQGNQRALDGWLNRLVAPAKPVHNRFRLPPIRATADLVKVLPAVLQAIARGRLSAQEGEAIARIIESQRRVIEAEEFDARLRALERKTAGGSSRSSETPSAGDSSRSAEQDSEPCTGEVVGANGPMSSRDSSTAAKLEQLPNAGTSGTTSGNDGEGECS